MNNKKKDILHFFKKKKIKWFIPIFGILTYWHAKLTFLTENKIIIKRDGSIFSENPSEYIEFQNSSNDFWVLKEYMFTYKFYKNLMYFTLFIGFFILLILTIIFNIQPFLDSILWKKSFKKSVKRRK